MIDCVWGLGNLGIWGSGESGDKKMWEFIERRTKNTLYSKVNCTCVANEVEEMLQPIKTWHSKVYPIAGIISQKETQDVHIFYFHTMLNLARHTLSGGEDP